MYTKKCGYFCRSQLQATKHNSCFCTPRGSTSPAKWQAFHVSQRQKMTSQVKGDQKGDKLLHNMFEVR